MNYREVVTNIISDAKLLTKMTARQSSIFRRKIYSRINEATETEEVHKEIPYPNKKRKIIDKDHNIGSLLILYKGLMEKYTTFTNNSKNLTKKNYILESNLKKERRKSYIMAFIVIYQQLILMCFILSILWIDVETFQLIQSKYQEYKKFLFQLFSIWSVFIIDNYIVPCFNTVFPYLKGAGENIIEYLTPVFDFAFRVLSICFVILLDNYIIPCLNFIFPFYKVTTLTH